MNASLTDNATFIALNLYSTQLVVNSLHFTGPTLDAVILAEDNDVTFHSLSGSVSVINGGFGFIDVHGVTSFAEWDNVFEASVSSSPLIAGNTFFYYNVLEFVDATYREGYAELQ